jgi:AraC-like DNA-binding protein
MNHLIHPQVIYFVKKECDPKWRIEKHKILYYDLVFVLEGSADYIIDGIPLQLQQGEILCLKPQSTRSARTSGMACVAIDFVLPENETIDLPLVTPCHELADFQWIFKEMNYEWLQKNEGHHMKCQALLTLVLHKLLYERAKHETNVHVGLIKRYIVEHYEEELTVKSLARVANINPVYCGALFKRVEKRTISDFINQVRINKAASLLESGEYNVGEVAAKTGFKDIYYFSSTFKRLMGVSPKSYRNKVEV